MFRQNFVKLTYLDVTPEIFLEGFRQIRDNMMNSRVTNPSTNSSDVVFGISAVSRLTGISPHVLRIWERRYQVVDPERSESKRREYSREDVRRLTLIKLLVDHGHSIRHVAPLSIDQLEDQWAEAAGQPLAEGSLPVDSNHAAGMKASANSQFTRARVAFIGQLARDPMREAADLGPELQVVAEFPDIESLRESLKPGAVDLIVAECPTLFEVQIAEIQGLVRDFRARRAILIYRFAKSQLVHPLDKDLRMITAMRAPVNAIELRMACTADLRLEVAERKSPDTTIDLPIAGDLPPRQFSDAMLARIARHSSAVQCECPQHLAGLLSSLAAFEKYSAECENLNEEDAQLHAYLHRATAECRARMEEALSHLMEVEGIQLAD